MRIAIVKLSAMGDIVHAMIVLQCIKKFNDKILIDWIVEERFKDLLKSNPHINNLHLVNFRDAKKKKSILALLRDLNKLRNHDEYDLVIDMQGLLKSAIISKLLPSKKIIGFDKLSSREEIASNFYNKRFNCSYETNVILRNIAIIEFALGFSIKKQHVYNKAPFLYTNVKELDFKITKSKKNILIIPGASHPSKRYPVSKLAEITKLICANFYVVWGNKEEQELANTIKKSSDQVKICSKFDLESLIFFISQLDLVIGPDTGPTHLAWALNIPSITLFGSTPGYRNSFETDINKKIESDSSVNPNKIDKNDYSIKNIMTSEIVKLTNQLIRD